MGKHQSLQQQGLGDQDIPYIKLKDSWASRGELPRGVASFKLKSPHAMGLLHAVMFLVAWALTF